MWLPFNDHGKTGEEAHLGLGKFGFMKLEVLIGDVGKNLLIHQRRLEPVCL